MYYIHMTKQLLMNLYIEYIQIPESMRHVFVARNSSNQTTEEEAPNFHCHSVSHPNSTTSYSTISIHRKLYHFSVKPLPK